MTHRQRSRLIAWIAGIAIAALLAIFAVPWGSIFGPGRSVAAYCRTWQEEGTKLRNRQIAAQNQGESGDIFGPITAAMGAPGDLAAFFDKLEKVAPDEIEPDVKRYRDAWDKIADSYEHGGWLEMLMTQAAVAAQVKGVESRIDTWTQTNCTANAH